MKAKRQKKSVSKSCKRFASATTCESSPRKTTRWATGPFSTSSCSDTKTRTWVTSRIQMSIERWKRINSRNNANTQGSSSKKSYSNLWNISTKNQPMPLNFMACAIGRFCCNDRLVSRLLPKAFIQLTSFLTKNQSAHMVSIARCLRAFNLRWAGDSHLTIGSTKFQLTTLWQSIWINLSKGLPMFGPAIVKNTSTTASAAQVQSLNNCEQSELWITQRPTGSINVSRKPCWVQCGRRPAR